MQCILLKQTETGTKHCGTAKLHVEPPVNIKIKFWNFTLLIYLIGVTTSEGTTSKSVKFNFFIGLSVTLLGACGHSKLEGPYPLTIQTSENNELAI